MADTRVRVDVVVVKKKVFVSFDEEIRQVDAGKLTITLTNAHV